MKKNTSPSPDPSIQVVTHERVYQNFYYHIDHDHLLMAGKTADYYVIGKNVPAVFVVATQDDRIVLNYEYRYPVRSWSYTIPAGSALPGETPDTAAARELTEETGYVASALKELAIVDALPGISSIKHHIFIATGLTQTERKLDHTESILHSHLYTHDEVKDLIMSGRLCDGPSIVAIQYYLIWHERHTHHT